MKSNIYHLRTLGSIGAEPPAGPLPSFDLGQILGAIFSAALGLIGDTRRALTTADWKNLIPGSGYWTDRLRNYLQSTIKYDVDLGNIQPFTVDFAAGNHLSIDQLNSYLESEYYNANGQPYTPNAPGTPGNGGSVTLGASTFGSILPLALIGWGFYKLTQSGNKPKRRKRK